MRSRFQLGAWALALAAAACEPSFGVSDAQITATRILAVRADPAEANPGTKVTFTSLVASPDGTVTRAAVAWSLCTAPKPLTEDNVVSNVCLGSGASLVAEGTGPSVTAATPGNACSLFGPDTASSAFRPRAPDATGGYYQPLRADLPGAAVAFALARIHCDLAGADAQAATAFAAAYTLNENPTLGPLVAILGGSPVSFDAIPAGARIELGAAWPAASAETFALFDAASQAVTMQRESMQVAWYTSAGALDTEATGRASSDSATTSSNGWTAPSAPGTAHLWVVLRDSRGGVDFVSQDATIVE